MTGSDLTGAEPDLAASELIVAEPIAPEPAGPEPAGPATPGCARDTEADWRVHANGRWIVQDAGRQPEVEALPAAGRAGTRPDTVIDGGRLGGLTYRATSQRGFAHQEVGTPRQDAYLVRPTPDRRWLVGCVADGVSEGKLSHEAADLVCQETTVRMARALTGLDLDRGPQAWTEAVARWPAIVAGTLPWSDIVEAANAAVRRAAKTAMGEGLDRAGDTAGLARLDEHWDDAAARKVMSSTAVVFAVSAVPAGDGSHPAVLAVLAGDSAALLLDNDGWTPLSAVKNEGAEIASSTVAPLPGTVRVTPHARMLRPGQTLVVLTDGLGDPLGSGGGVVGEFLASMWRRPPELFAFAQQVGFYRKSFADDRTAVAIWADRP
ncbi:protein phosphatase 2C domain-containing protein [Micromonosporaceae bacterium Da 78-11]